MLQPYPTPPRRATGQALWSYLYQLAEQLNAQAAPAAASETAAPNGGSAARIAAEARQTAANALAAVSTAASTVENAATTAENAATAAASADAKADAAASKADAADSKAGTAQTAAESAATAAANAGAKADAASADAASALSAAQDLAEITDALQAGLDAKAPQSHASTQTTYGIGNAASYGHVRLSDATDSTLGEPSGTAATPTAVRNAYAAALAAKSRADDAYARADDAYTSADAAGLDASNAQNAVTAAQATADAAMAAAEASAPKNHAVSATTFGAGTSANYGHVRLSDATDSTSAASGGTAATPAAVKAAYDLADGKAPKAHASTATTYGKGTSTNYGHVKLSDSILSTSDTAGGTAATPGAVKKAYDLANRAETTLLGGKKIVCGWSAVHFKNTGQQNTTISFGTTFTAKPIVIIGQPFNGVICTVFKDSVTTTNFTVNVPAVGSATLSTRQMAWIAIGSI